MIKVNYIQKKRSERIVDPVAMKLRDPARESEYPAKKESAMADRVRVARQEISQKFNILNHQGPPRKIEKDPPRVLGASKREFHLLTNMKIDDHVSAPIIYNDNYVQEKTKRPPRVLPFTAPNRREFDVISNNYYTDNEVRQVRDKEAIKEHVEDVYWKTHDYDLLKGEFYSKEKEDDFQEQRRLVSSVQGLSQQYRLPPRYCRR